MEGRRVYRGSKMAAMLQNEGISAEAIEAVLASGSSSRGLGGSRSMVSFEDVHRSTPKGSFYCTHALEEIGDEDFDECIQKPGKKRRLTTDQILFLEKTFELENKLEPEKKVQLAKDLALQPRQVAIWFQNRRARWKTKQLEKDFEALKSSYNVLKDNYENLFKEKEKLKEEIMLLSDKLLHKEKGNLETFKSKALHLNLSYPESNPVSEIKTYNPSTAVNKHEDVSSSNSGVSDSNSPLCVNGVVETFIYELGDSNAFEANHSDLSHEERDEEGKCCGFPKLEDVSYNYGFAIEDQGLWSWPYA